jgi:Zinc finger, C2H2 type
LNQVFDTYQNDDVLPEFSVDLSGVFEEFQPKKVEISEENCENQAEEKEAKVDFEMSEDDSLIGDDNNALISENEEAVTVEETEADNEEEETSEDSGSEFELKSKKTKQCWICRKVLSSNQAMKQHIKVVHEKKTRFTCPRCPKAFYYKRELQFHIVRCHEASSRTSKPDYPFKCEFDGCRKSFKTKQELQSHQMIHSGEFHRICETFSSKN